MGDITSSSARDPNAEEWVMGASFCARQSSLLLFFHAPQRRLQRRRCMGGYSHLVTVKWIFVAELNNLFSSPLVPFVRACRYVPLWIVVAGTLWTPAELCSQSVSDESPGRWQGVITQRKTQRYENSKRDREDWYLSRGHTCENMPMTLSPLGTLSSLALPSLYSPLTASYNLTVAPLLLHFYPLFTSGIYTNKSNLSPWCNPSIIACDQLKITLWEQKEWASCAKAPMLMLLIVEEMNIPLQSDWGPRNGDGAGVIPWLMLSSCNAWLILKCEWVFNQGHMRYDKL